MDEPEEGRLDLADDGAAKAAAAKDTVSHAGPYQRPPPPHNGWALRRGPFLA